MSLPSVSARMRREENKQKSLVHLQGVGDIPGKPAQEFKPGDFMAWNNSGFSQVLGIESETEAYITFRLLDLWTENDWNTAREGTRRLKKTRLVAIGDEKRLHLLTKNYPPKAPDKPKRDKEYTDMTEEELAQVRGRFRVGDAEEEYEVLLDAIKIAEGIAHTKHIVQAGMTLEKGRSDFPEGLKSGYIINREWRYTSLLEAIKLIEEQPKKKKAGCKQMQA